MNNKRKENLEKLKRWKKTQEIYIYLLKQKADTDVKKT